jgi:hypothetical protein
MHIGIHDLHTVSRHDDLPFLRFKLRDADTFLYKIYIGIEAQVPVNTGWRFSIKDWRPSA